MSLFWFTSLSHFSYNVFLWFWTALEEVKHCSVFENIPTGCKYVHSSLLTLLQVSTNTWQGHSVDRCRPTRVPEGVCWSKYVELVFLEMELLSFSGATILSHRIIVFISFFSWQWSMKMSVLSSRDSCSQTFAHICPTFPTPQRKRFTTSPWKKSSPESSPSRSK